MDDDRENNDARNGSRYNLKKVKSSHMRENVVTDYYTLLPIFFH